MNIIITLASQGGGFGFPDYTRTLLLAGTPNPGGETPYYNQGIRPALKLNFTAPANGFFLFNTVSTAGIFIYDINNIKRAYWYTALNEQSNTGFIPLSKGERVEEFRHAGAIVVAFFIPCKE